MLHPDHNSRYSLQEVYNHKWFFRSVKKPCIKSKKIAKKAKEVKKESKILKIRKAKAKAENK